MLDIDWQKVSGLIPAIIQDQHSGAVLMLGYMNEEALQQTQATGLVTFYSRTKERLWVKGETSGNHLRLRNIHLDCDRDTLLVFVEPKGPACHLGSDTCFASQKGSDFAFLGELERTILERRDSTGASAGTYTKKLFKKGRDKIAQKVGEEAVEVVIASKNSDDGEFISECADLVYHLTVLIADRRLRWKNVISKLGERKKAKK